MGFFKEVWEILKPTWAKTFITLILYVLIHLGLYYGYIGFVDGDILWYLFLPHLLISEFFLLPVYSLKPTLGSGFEQFALSPYVMVYSYIADFISWYVILCILSFIVNELKKQKQ